MSKSSNYISSNVRNVPKRTRGREGDSDEDIEALRGAWSGAEVIPDDVARKLMHRKAKQ